MAKIAHVIDPGYPHHITQRGNRGQQNFFCDDDYLAYIELIAHWCKKYQIEIWSWCLMPNHVHLIAVPHKEEMLRSWPSLALATFDVACTEESYYPYVHKPNQPKES